MRFYRDVDNGTDVDAALQAEYGLSEREFTDEWRDRLQELAA